MFNIAHSDHSNYTNTNSKITIGTPHVLSKICFLLKVVAPALSVPPDHGCAQEERVKTKSEKYLSKVDEKRTDLIRWAFYLPPPSEFLWMMGVQVSPSSNSLLIIHSFNDRASFGIMTGIGLFFDSIHSICYAFAPFIVTWVLRGMKKSSILSLIFPIKNSSKNVRSKELWAISNRRFWRKRGNLKEV